ncbi:S-adenosyl-methyltransferase MraW [Propionibacterium sp. oral taxon 192 str. F0372]|uniref:16S rRNA (cytosine(1402)-N(4))-methyltransferase RsmH n=1 Tax=Propionibacterium sp. oral taxon 192 TaxID=671222 RepID=UPI000352796D|nr:16S rRNA (cytosine(1402)-N(4))-methyltransferase RsmH [Propionibacterium sp. oral taxon 192]EPH02609.1 S-adenosyl-methyltransferase MraW [Propionibacterium sp. oral taxon 192 str. F0372]
MTARHNAASLAVNRALPDALPALATREGRVIHIPVLRERITRELSDALDVPDAIHVDLTTGMAGHASAILVANPRARVIGIDRDASALEIARETLAPFGERVHLIRAGFDELNEVLDELGVKRVHSVLADLGLSSMQIDQRERGFAYAVDSPLDMRMDSRQQLTAADLLNKTSANELVDILRTYGEEPHAERIVRGIVAAREAAPFTDSARLVQVISDALPASARNNGHPGKRTFQALRIRVNGELDALEQMLPTALNALEVGGRFAVLAYHSLEDRMVKRTFTEACSDHAPARLPVVPPELMAKFTPVTRKAVRPDPDEVEANPRAASARLRIVERIRPGAVMSKERQR